ncbi:MAG TPA: TonB family protein [Fimbriimonadaceae bacterium]|nr:TonB family protein [Fimbriimonadaceae bacterium]
MSRRRRKGNKLLARILLISVAVHVIAVPILAKYGAFDKIRREFVTNTVTVIPPPPPDTEKPVEKKVEQKKQLARARGSSHASRAQARSNAPHPPVVASNAAPTGQGDNGPTINPNGTGTPGVVPKGTGPTGLATNPGTTKPATEPVATPATTPAVKPATKPDVKPAPVQPHVPVIVTAEAVYQPQPQVPDDLRADALDKTCVVEISVGADGDPASVKIDTSCGIDELDQIALDAARKWRFKPATADGSPIPSIVRLHVEFKVD